MNLDLIALSVLLIFMLLFGIFILLIIIGAGLCKTEEEKRYEDIEQMNYLKNYKEKKNNKKTKE